MIIVNEKIKILHEPKLEKHKVIRITMNKISY